MKTVWYYVKQMFIPIMYLIIFDIIALGILCIGDNLIVLKVILLILNLGLYGFILASVAFKDGETALKIRMSNDLNREQIIKTGKEYPIKLNEEFKPWKGYLMGFTNCIPLILLMLVHVILTAGKDPFAQTTQNTAGAIAGLAYMVFFSFAQVKTTTVLISTTYYVSLIAIPIFIAVIGFPYWLGGQKVIRQQEMIKEKHRQIYGDKS